MNFTSIDSVGRIGRPVGLSPNVDATALMQNVQDLRGLNVGGAQEEGEGFASLLDAYLGMVNDVSRLENRSQQLSIDYALGRHDDMVAVILAQEAAYASLHFAAQVTNRIIEAYREIMRMQI